MQPSLITFPSVRFDVVVVSRRVRQLQQMAVDVIETACRAMIVGVANVSVGEIAVNLFRVTISLSLNSTVSIEDVIGMVWRPDLVTALSTALQRQVSLVASSVEVNVDGIWMSMSPPPSPPSSPSPTMLPPPSVPPAAPVSMSIVIAASVVVLVASIGIVVAVLLWKRRIGTQFVISQIPSTLIIPQTVSAPPPYSRGNRLGRQHI